jgi:ligand-binding sensor domain-containing protein
VLRFDPSLWLKPSNARATTVLNVQNGLPAARVNDLLLRAGDPGEVLVATDAGLVRVSAEGRPRGRVLLRGQRVTALTQDVAGTWKGLYVIHHHTQQASVIAGSKQLTVTDLLSCDDALYVATHDSGLWRWRSGRLDPVPGVPAVRVGGLTGCDAHRPVWAATTAGLYVVTAADGPGRACAAWSDHATRAHFLRRTGALVLGTFGEGAYLLESGALHPLLPRGRVTLIHSHREALLIATDRGLWVWRRGRPAVSVQLPGPPPGLVTALAPFPGGLWVGTFDGGIGVQERGRWRRCPTPDGRITALLLGPTGALWVGTAAGLLVGQHHGTAVSRVTDPRGWLRHHVSALRRQGPRIWVAVHPGLVAIDTRRGRSQGAFSYYGARGRQEDRGLVGTTVYGLAVTSAGIWAGTDRGLSLMAPGGVTRSLTDLEGALPDNWINDVRASGDAIHLLTLRSGLMRIQPGGSEIWSTALMTSPSVLQPLGRHVVFGTNDSGLAVVEGPGTIRTYGPAQGIASATVSALAHDPTTDRLWVGGNGGIDRIDNVHQALGARCPDAGVTQP